MNAHQRRIQRRAWQRRVELHAFSGAPLPVIDLTPAELARLPEYSMSLPTGALPGRQWRLDVAFRMSRVRRLGPGLRPPRGVGQVWYHAIVTKEPHGNGGHKIAYRRVRLVSGVC